MISINEFIEKVKETLEVNNFNITPETGIRDFPKWSSMNALILIAMFETEFDATLTGDDLRNCNTVSDLYNLLSKNS